MKNKKPRPPKPGSPAWMATWSDLVSLLMCFFVLLFAMSNTDEAKFQEFAEAMAGRRIFLQGALGQIFNDSSGMLPDNSPPSVQAPRVETPPEEEEDDAITEAVRQRLGQAESIADTFRTYMAPYDDAAQQIGISVDDLGEYVRLTFPDGMLFGSGQATLLPAAAEMIDYVAGHLADYPGHRIQVQGHTDDIPINTVQFPSNFHLSAARAIAVTERLRLTHGFDPKLLEPMGRGEFWPVDTNATAEGRANNRRVEILLFAQQQNLTVIQ